MMLMKPRITRNRYGTKFLNAALESPCAKVRNTGTPQYPGFRKAGTSRLARAIAAVAGLVAFAPALLCQTPEARSVLILNSDMHVEKYLVAQSTFKSALNRPTFEIDLGKNWQTEGRLEEVIRSQNPETFYCIGSKAFLVGSRLANNRPLVLSSAINWERFPKRNNTFIIANELPVAVQLTLFRYCFPKIRTLGVLYSRAFNQQWVDAAIRESKEFDLSVTARAVSSPENLESELRRLLPVVDALWITSDPVVLANRTNVEQIFRLADQDRKPIFAYSTAFAELGAALIISPDDPTIGRQAAGIVESLLSNGSFDSKAQFPAGSQIVLNLKKVEAYGLEFNEDALDSVNRILR